MLLSKINNTLCPIAVELTTLEIKRTNHYAPFTFTNKNIIIHAVNPYTNYIYINYTDKDTANVRYVTVPFNFEVKILKGLKKKKTLDEYKQILIKNLTTSLGHSFNIGADPEFFVSDDKDSVIPAFEFLGSKTKPLHRAYEKPVYWDGFQGEFEIIPNTCLAYTVDYLREGLKVMLSAAKEKFPNAKLLAKTTVDIPTKILMESKEEHVNFGCTPSLNVYKLKGLSIPGRDVPFRSAGGHMHFGIGATDEKRASRIVKALDAIIGVACVSLFQGIDKPERRLLYGLPGEYRLPKHGLEYRTLSNAWMFHPLMSHLVFDIARKALVLGDKDLFSAWKASEKTVIKTLLTCDVSSAKRMLKTNKDIFKKLIMSTGKNDEDSEAIFNIFMNGMSSVIKDPLDIETNWKLNTTWATHSNSKNVSWLTSRESILAGKKI